MGVFKIVVLGQGNCGFQWARICTTQPNIQSPRQQSSFTSKDNSPAQPDLLATKAHKAELPKSTTEKEEEMMLYPFMMGDRADYYNTYLGSYTDAVFHPKKHTKQSYRSQQRAAKKRRSKRK